MFIRYGFNKTQWKDFEMNVLNLLSVIHTKFLHIDLDFTDYITFISWQHLVMHCIIHVRSSVLRSGQVYIAFIQKAMLVQFSIKNTYFIFFIIIIESLLVCGGYCIWFLSNKIVSPKLLWGMRVGDRNHLIKSNTISHLRDFFIHHCDFFLFWDPSIVVSTRFSIRHYTSCTV